MNTQKFKGTIETAYGTKISPALDFAGEFEAYGPEKKVYTAADWQAAIDEIKAANEFPSNEEIVGFVNNKAKANARAKVTTETLKAAGYEKPTLETSPEMQLKSMVAALVASGKYTQAQAESFAATALGVEAA